MFEAYRIGIKLALIDSASGALAGIAARFGMLHRDQLAATGSLAEYEKRLKSIQTMGLVGGAMAGVGIFGLKALDAPLEEAKKFQTEVAKFSTLGFGDAVTTQATKFAKGMETVGTSARDNLTLVADAMAVFKNLDHAEMAAPIMAKMKFANEAIFGKEGGSANDRKFMDMLKVIEFRGGLKSDAEFATQANFVQQVISGSRNRVDAGQLLSALKTGGVALSQRQNADFYLGSEPLIQEFGGQRYGTGAMSIYQNLVQSRGTITAQQELNRLGLLDQDKIQFNQLGQLKKALPGAFKGSEVLEKQGELALLEKVLLPAFAAKGITGDEAIIRELGMILGNRTGSSLMSRIYQQRETLHTQVDANRSAENIDQATKTASGTMAGKEIDLTAKWKSLLLELGTTVLPLAVKGLEWLIGTIKTLTAFARENPGLTKTIVLTGAAVATLLTLGGVALVASAGIRGLSLALSFAGLGGVPGILKMASAFTMAGLSLAGLFKIAAAGAAGYAVGSAIYKATENTSMMRDLGRGLGKAASWLNLGDAREAEGQTDRWEQYAKAHPFGPQAGTTAKAEARGASGPWVAAEAAAAAKAKAQPSIAAQAGPPAKKQDASLPAPLSTKVPAAAAMTPAPTMRNSAAFLAPFASVAPTTPKPTTAAAGSAVAPAAAKPPDRSPAPFFAPLTSKAPTTPAPISTLTPVVRNIVSLVAPLNPKGLSAGPVSPAVAVTKNTPLVAPPLIVKFPAAPVSPAVPSTKTGISLVAPPLGGPKFPPVPTAGAGVAAPGAPLTVKYPVGPVSPAGPTIKNTIALVAPPLSTKAAPARAVGTGPSTTNPAAFMTTKPSTDTAPRTINLVVDGRVLARVMDDHVNRVTGSGAGMGTTQFDPSFSVPPLALPGGAK